MENNTENTLDLPKIEIWPVKKIKPYKNNHKKHLDEQIENLCNSIKTFGYITPIVIDSKGIIQSGEGRYLACKKMGYENIPVIVKDIPNSKAYRVIDNEISKHGVVYNNEITRIEMEDFKVDVAMLQMAGLKPQDYHFEAPKIPQSIIQSAFQQAEQELYDEVGRDEETDEEYLKNFKPKEESVNKENITLNVDNKPKTFHFYIEVKTELSKENIKNEIQGRLNGITAIIR